MKVQRDLTTILYILVSGIYLIVGARSFARAPDTPETGYFYLIGLITWVVATLVWMQQSQIQASSTSDTKNSGEETLGSHRAARISYLMSIGFMSICSVDATFSSAEGTLSSRILPICQFISAIITPCLFLHCFLIFPVEKKFIQRHTWMLKAPLPSGDCSVSLNLHFLFAWARLYPRVFHDTVISSGKHHHRISFYLFDCWSAVTPTYLFRRTVRLPTPSSAMVAAWNCCGDIPPSYFHDNSTVLGGLDSLHPLLGLHVVPYPNLLCHSDYSAPVDEYRTHHQSQRCVHACQRVCARHLSVKYPRTYHVFPYGCTFSNGDSDIGAYCGCALCARQDTHSEGNRPGIRPRGVQLPSNPFGVKPNAPLDPRFGNLSGYLAPPSYESDTHQSRGRDVSRVRLL